MVPVKCRSGLTQSVETGTKSVLLANVIFHAFEAAFVRSGLVVVEPDEHGYGILDRGPEWQRLACYSFFQTALVSIVIEVAALLPIRKWAELRHVIVPVILGNCLSYTVLGVGFVVMFGG